MARYDLSDAEWRIVEPLLRLLARASRGTTTGGWSTASLMSEDRLAVA